MLLILSDNTDIYYNLATEDYFLNQRQEDVLMLWRSSKAVVCGKHQNLCAELDYEYCRKNGIAMSRRLTGGGTVFHDLGNVNFTFIKTIEEGLEYSVDYRRFLEPIREAMAALGIETTYSQRNDLLIEGKKISGNAEHVLQKKKRVLHHGTLLFNTNLYDLGNTLHPKGIYTDKAVKSVRSPVTNISEHYLQEISTEMFIQKLANHFLMQKHTNRYVLNAYDEENIINLRNEKYQTHAWIVGYSPSYHVQKSISYQNSNYEIALSVEKGVITHLVILDAAGKSVPGSLAEFIHVPLTEALNLHFAQTLFPKQFENLAYCLF